ncbi:MAG TPA: cytochrome c biogenesis heme-transporting ATPase CcmA [Steroidobacteraceae bacterium]|jgi:heme exporter protein A
MNELTADNLQLWRGEQHVLRGVCLAVSLGECLQVTGANGAGKTTLLRALCGLVPLEEGRICWRGDDVAFDRLAFHDELNYLGHDNALKADLTAAENLRYAVALRRRVTSAQIAAALARTGVAEAERQPVRQLSAGQRRRVALARVLLGGGALWLLDEPGANLDAHGQQLLRELIAQHLQAGGLAVIATHHALDLPGAPLRSLTLQ